MSYVVNRQSQWCSIPGVFRVFLPPSEGRRWVLEGVQAGFRGAELAAGGLGSCLGRRPRFPAPTTHLQLGEKHQSDPVGFTVRTEYKQSVHTKYKSALQLK